MLEGERRSDIKGEDRQREKKKVNRKKGREGVYEKEQECMKEKKGEEEEQRENANIYVRVWESERE